MSLYKDRQPFPTLTWDEENNPEPAGLPLGEIRVPDWTGGYTTDLVYDHPAGFIVIHDQQIVDEGYISKASVYHLKEKDELKLLLVENKLDFCEVECL